MRGLFTRVARRYDRLNRVLSLGLDVLWRRRALAALAHESPAPNTILDIATGTADFAIAAARRFPDARVIGIDLTPAMLELGRQKVSAAGLAKRIDLVEGSAHALPCPNGTANAVLCAFGFRNFPDRGAALREAARALADGGYLLVLELFRPRFRFLGWPATAWLKCAATLFAGGAKDEYSYLRESIGDSCTTDEFAQAARSAGFSPVRRFFLIPSCTCLLFRKNMVE